MNEMLATLFFIIFTMLDKVELMSLRIFTEYSMKSSPFALYSLMFSYIFKFFFVSCLYLNYPHTPTAQTHMLIKVVCLHNNEPYRFISNFDNNNDTRFGISLRFKCRSHHAKKKPFKATMY